MGTTRIIALNLLSSIFFWLFITLSKSDYPQILHVPKSVSLSCFLLPPNKKKVYHYLKRRQGVMQLAELAH